MSGIEELLVGRRLASRYQVEEVIGRGGMGAVYAALDERLDRRVAIKVIALAAVEAEARERQRARFRREAQAAAGIHHPNVATVHDFATDAELGLDFLVMELLRGEDLASRLARAAPLPLPLALRILRDTAAGLAAGHRRGLVHRDVKPGNVFLAEGEGDAELRVCVLDFGIARLATAEESLTQLTVDGGIGPLSPAYASPEQLRGERDLTPASDVYSLGLIGFELLTGNRLFASEDLSRGATPIPPPKLRALNPEVPPEVDELLQRALAHEPRARFADTEAFARALATATADRATAYPVAVAAPPPPLASAPPSEESATVLLPRKSAEATATLFAPSPLPPPAEYRGAAPARRHTLPRASLLALLLLALALTAGAVLLASGGSSGEASAAAAPEQQEDVAPAMEEPVLRGDRERAPAAAAPSPAPARAAVERPPRPPAARAERENRNGGKARGHDKPKKNDKLKQNGKGNGKGKKP